MSGETTVETVVEAMRRGATDYMVKPLVPARLRRLGGARAPGRLVSLCC
jgi:DNA-binding NtrC family response regulator